MNENEDEFAALLEWELNKRRGRSATYTQPLIGGKHPLSIEEEENVHSFLSEFYSYQIYDSMMNMKHILQIYSDTVAIHYGLLVPNVCSFDEFWSRYFYRCSIVQVKKDIMARQQRTGSYTRTADDYSDSTTNMDNDSNNAESLTVDVAVAQQPVESESQSIPSNNNNDYEATNSNTATTTKSSNLTQMFYQENDRDIIEVIPEEENDDEDDINEFDTVSITEDRSSTRNVLRRTIASSTNKHVAIGF